MDLCVLPDLIETAELILAQTVALPVASLLNIDSVPMEIAATSGAPGPIGLGPRTETTSS